MRFPASIARLLRRNHLAFILLLRGRRISFSLLRDNWHEEKRLEMIKRLRELLVIAMLGVVLAGGAFAQKPDRDKRPPKEPVKIKTNDKDQRPPRNSNQQRPKPDKPNRP